MKKYYGVKKRALFLDRDGVINRMVLYRTGWDSPQRPQDVKLIEGISEIISWANQKEIPVIEISNQPGVAKGKMRLKTANDIEKRIHKLLGKCSAIINKKYICQHHPNAVVLKYKIECDCRKPKPGLFFKASEELDIDLSRSIFLGDKASDAMAGKNAGCKVIIYLHKEDIEDKVLEAENCESDYKIKKMTEVLKILQKEFKSI